MDSSVAGAWSWLHWRSFSSQRFVSKAAAALLLVLIADQLFQGLTFGWTLGLFGACIVAAVGVFRVQGRPNEYLFTAMAAGSCVALINDTSWLALLLLWCVLAALVLEPIFAGAGDSRKWLASIFGFTLIAPLRPFVDLLRLRKAAKRRRFIDVSRIAATLALPVFFVLLFSWLFVAANPLIERAVDSIRWRSDFAISFDRILIWYGSGVIVWALLRSRVPRLAVWPAMPGLGAEKAVQSLFTPAAVLATLVLCNGLFLIENLLDVAYLWGGRALPEGMTYAAYAQRGAYPLIATALLAGAFVLIALRPGSQTEHDRRIRALVYLWLGQNVFLVASSVLRTLYYVEAYSLTLLRLSAIIWMGLVLVGLILIVVRIVWNKSGLWLINANAVAAFTVLYAASFADIAGFVSQYNVKHAREITGSGVDLDVSYLRDLGAPAIPALQWFIDRTEANTGAAAATSARYDLAYELEKDQANWRTWTWQGSRLLAEADAWEASRRQIRRY